MEEMEAWLLKEKAWCDDNVFRPDDTLLGAFFAEVSEAGPTASATAWGHMSWWTKRLGLGLPLTSPLVADFRFAREGHRVQAAVPLDIPMLPCLVNLAQGGNGARGVFAGFALLFAAACVRFRHVQRSTFLHADGEFLFAECKKGKSRRQGLRTGYQWAAPRCWGPGKDVLAGVVRVLHGVRKVAKYQELPFLLPDLKTNGMSIADDDVWLQTPMAAGRFIALFRGLVSELGMEPEKVEKQTYNSLRRFLPTGADALDLDDTMAAGIGNWQDSSRGSCRRKKRSLQQPMAKRYADDQVRTAASHKRWIVAAAMLEAEQSGGAATWATVRRRAWTEEALEVLSREFVVPGISPGIQHRVSLSEPSFQPALSWFIQFQPSERHRPWIHVTKEGGAVPFCRRVPFANPPVMHDTDFSAAAATGERLCPKCLVNLGGLASQFLHAFSQEQRSGCL